MVFADDDVLLASLCGDFCHALEYFGANQLYIAHMRHKYQVRYLTLKYSKVKGKVPPNKNILVKYNTQTSKYMQILLKYSNGLH